MKKLVLLALLVSAAPCVAQQSSGGSSGASGAAGGSLSGTYPNPTVATNANLTGDVTSVGNATTLVNIPALSGANLTTLNGTNISSGTVSSTRGGTGVGNAGTLTYTGSVTLGTAAAQNTGTSGANIPLLNAANTFSANQQIGSGSTLTISGGSTGDAIAITNSIPNINAAQINFSNGATTANVYATILPQTFALANTGASIASLLTVPASGTWQLGNADAAAPVAQTLRAQSVVAGTSNTAGADWTISASRGTGTGVGGKIIVKTAPAGTTGTAQNALVTAFTFDKGLPIRPSYTVSTLPASPIEGAMAIVTDNTIACVFLATLTGGGSNHCPVGYVNGSWVIE